MLRVDYFRPGTERPTPSTKTITLRMKQRLFQLGILVLFLAIGAWAARGFLQNRPDKTIPVKSMKTWQDADAPLGFSVDDHTPDFDPRFIQLTAFERARIPISSRMSAAMGTEHGALTYNAQPFWSNNAKRGGHHSGDDINGIGGMHTDLGDPVYAIANGLVIYRGEPSPGWGNVLILAHRTPMGKIQLSMYAHLQKMHVAYLDLIYRGEIIGTVGTANLHYIAHLHLEMLDSTGVPIGKGYTDEPAERINPTTTITAQDSLSGDFLYTTPLAIVLEEKLSGQNENISIQHKKNPTK